MLPHACQYYFLEREYSTKEDTMAENQPPCNGSQLANGEANSVGTSEPLADRTCTFKLQTGFGFPPLSCCLCAHKSRFFICKLSKSASVVTNWCQRLRPIYYTVTVVNAGDQLLVFPALEVDTRGGTKPAGSTTGLATKPAGSTTGL
jgi:hypothetical protein